MLSSFLFNWFCLFIRRGVAPVGEPALLMEDGNFLLQENDSKILL